MTERHDEEEAPVDLSALSADVDPRVVRVLSGLDARIAQARASERSAPPLGVGEAVRRRLARLALPAAVAAAVAVAAVIRMERRSAAPGDVFVGLVLGDAEPVAGWIAEGRRPAMPELIRLMEGGG